ncbi:hypothetical protein SLS58_008703 [Diplodia intermedia]|uniref:TLC domain-containing protein n=1 Tax=Diplodia intermedia TaxID=856260 RepID=A0ABR3TGX2_9PEZI
MPSTLATTIAHDAAIAGAAYATTSLLYRASHRYLKSAVSHWDAVKPGVQNRMACEIALLPTRAILFLLCAPAIMSAFAAPEIWTHLDTYRMILASAIMGGSYMFDLTIERNDTLSLIHHFMGPALLLWVRCSYSAFASSDALMCRMLVSFVFFGAGVGGSVTTVMLVLMKLFKRQIPPLVLARAVVALSWMLTLNTWLSTMYGCTYLLWAFEELHGHWGDFAGLVPLALCGFEFWLQWRWALRFQGISEGLRAAAGIGAPVVSEEEVKQVGGGRKRKQSVLSSFEGMSAEKISANTMALSWAVGYSGVCMKVLEKLTIRLMM